MFNRNMWVFWSPNTYVMPINLAACMKGSFIRENDMLQIIIVFINSIKDLCSKCSTLGFVIWLLILKQLEAYTRAGIGVYATLYALCFVTSVAHSKHDEPIFEDCAEKRHSQHQQMHHSLGLPFLVRSATLAVSMNFLYQFLILLTFGGPRWYSFLNLRWTETGDFASW